MIQDSGTNDSVVCAAVSSVAQSTTIGLMSVLGLDGQLNVDKGLLEFRIEKDNKYYDNLEKIKTLIDTLILMLKEIKGKYPEEIEIKFMEVKDGS